MSQTRCLSADEPPVLHSTTDSGAAGAAADRRQPSLGAASTVEVLEQLQAELAEFLAETKGRLERACERTDESSAYEPAEPTPADAPGNQPSNRQLADESLDRLQQIKRRLAAQLQQ